MGTFARTIFLISFIALVVVLILRWALKFISKEQACKEVEEVSEKSSKKALPSKTTAKQLPAPPPQETVEEEESLRETISDAPGMVEEIQEDFGGLMSKAQDQNPPSAGWPAKERLEYLEVQYGPLPSFIQAMFDEKDE